jgi:hypothetical protein
MKYSPEVPVRGVDKTHAAPLYPKRLLQATEEEMQSWQNYIGRIEIYQGAAALGAMT